MTPEPETRVSARRFIAPVLAMFTLAAAACAGSAASGRLGHAVAPTPPPVCAAPRSIQDSANGDTVRLCSGQSLVLALHSTYWEAISSSNPAVLRTEGRKVVPATPGTCVPGGGCGGLVTEFVADSPGTSRITAHRSTCGEALACQPAREAFSVTVVVRGSTS